MLNPPAYRAALLDQLTSAAEAPSQSEDSSASHGEEDEKRTDVNSVARGAPSSKLRFPRVTPLVRDDATQDTRMSGYRADEGQPVAHTLVAAHAPQQRSEDRPYTVGYGSLVEREKDRSLILDFIDNCIRSGVPEETIAEQVQFMVASMKESLALHAALHAQRHKERIREYELGALTNMLERQQLQLQQQQQLPAPSTQYEYPLASPPVSLQLSPPPPLVSRRPFLDSSPHPSYPASTSRASPQRRDPSPPRDDSSLSRAGMRRGSAGSSSALPSPLPISTWRPPAPASNEENIRPAVQPTSVQRRAHKAEEERRGRRSLKDAMSSHASSRRSSIRSSSSTTARTHAAHHHRGHHALCDVCLRNATETMAAAEGAAERTSPVASAKAPRKNASTSSRTARTPARRSSPTASRQRYQPQRHYMKPTHASLVRRASPSSSPVQVEQTPLTSHAPSRMTSPAARPLRKAHGTPLRKLVVRSTYSSRLRAAACRPSNSSAEASASDVSAVDEEEHRHDDDVEGEASHRGDFCSDVDEVDGRRSDLRVRVESPKVVPRHEARQQVDVWARQDTKSGHKMAALDLYSTDSPSALTRPRAAAAAAAVTQIGGSVSARQTAPLTSFPQPSQTWRPSIDPEPPRSFSAVGSSGDAAPQQRHSSSFMNATTLQWEQKSPSSPPPASETQTSEEPTQRHAQESSHDEASRRPRRDPPVHPPSSAASSSGASTTAQSRQKLFTDNKAALSGARTAPNDDVSPALTSRTSVVVVDSDIDGDAGKAVCVTSPALQLFLERSQRKVRETERVLARTPSPASGRLSPSRTSTIHLSPQPQWHPQPPQPQHRSFQELVSSSHASSSLSPRHRDARSSLWSDRSLDAVRGKQQQRLQELRNRLRDYGTPGGHDVREANAVKRHDETTFASSVASSAAPSQDPHLRFQVHGVAPLSTSPENSPLVQISPTSSDEDKDEL
ncbi:hypothetical protein ABB37_05641 [Leptomonas pyrrhocoris]|uniref:Uncharacterized protein n=1 Tax=Leptomonas pyrrhocoris TaxID=157538 RepID=A0A0M9FZ61_LEPPY|nr:hypothetical protein ABB37_05641 [Leptomonas pyrrhocoris]KPA79130.1 hypothetical protein ABB37_05641 [Leptomonas pyrrhocoris]|eukprot:XP_015657569.1 hypothetical protein ABB37_05641 [Leptomonas pyrrhocoris]